MGPPRIATYCWVIGTIFGLAGWSLFFRMILELNKVLPAQNRLSLIEFRYHIGEIKRLHAELFPISTLRVTALLLIAASAAAVGVGIVVAIAG